MQHTLCRHMGGVGGPADRDRIHLSGLVFHGYHGVLPEVNGSHCGSSQLSAACLRCHPGAMPALAMHVHGRSLRALAQAADECQLLC